MLLEYVDDTDLESMSVPGDIEEGLVNLRTRIIENSDKMS